MTKVRLLAIFLLFANFSFTLCRNLMMENSTLFEGDVTEVNYDPFEIYESAPDDVQSAAGGRLTRRWPRATIPFEFAPNYDSNARASVQVAIRYFMRTVPCIKIVPRRPNDRNFVRIINGNGCFAPIGMRFGRQDISLNVPTCLQRGIVVHEFLHSFGVFHEQSRPDRDNFVTIFPQNIRRDLLFNFNKFSTNEIFTDTPYDYNSVMHYGRKDFSINGRDTLVPKRNVRIGQREGLSRTDILGINRLYGCGRSRDTESKYRNNGVIWQFDEKRNLVWDSGCDFKTNNYQNVTASQDVCVKFCQKSKRCTHFTHHSTSSLCVMREKTIKRENIVKIESDDVVCGYTYKCVDKDENCQALASKGKCKTNQNFMFINCCKSCRDKNREKI